MTTAAKPLKKHFFPSQNYIIVALFDDPLDWALISILDAIKASPSRRSKIFLIHMKQKAALPDSARCDSEILRQQLFS